jgi:hypothetical protein
MPYCHKNRISILAFSPLGSGIGNIRRNDPSGVLGRVAAATGKTEAQVALNWCIAKEGVIALTKSNSPERVAEDCQASGCGSPPSACGCWMWESSIGSAAESSLLFAGPPGESMPGAAASIRSGPPNSQAPFTQSERVPSSSPSPIAPPGPL